MFLITAVILFIYSLFFSLVIRDNEGDLTEMIGREVSNKLNDFEDMKVVGMKAHLKNMLDLLHYKK